MTFDRSLKPMVTRALEGAGFVGAYDGVGILPVSASPAGRLDEAAARDIALKRASMSSCRAGSAVEAVVTRCRSRPFRPLPDPP